MSKRLRQDKTCLNCGATVEKKYCSKCGQENIELRESFSHLVRHFFGDITHYDSKFLTTIKDLLVRPGFLTKEYLVGKRATYLHPIRMYMFISFVYFLVMFTFNKTSFKFNNKATNLEEILVEKTAVETRKQVSDSIHAIQLNARQDTVNGKIKESVLNKVLASMQHDTYNKDFAITIIGGINSKELLAFDSVQKLLPASKQDHGIKSWFYHRWIPSLKRYGSAGTLTLIAEKTKHFIPKMMFLLLPIFALCLKLFYSPKKYFYSDHAIFTMHFHSAVFLLFLLFNLVEIIFPTVTSFLGSLELILAFVYLVIAVRNAYQQSWLTSIVKSTGLTLLYSVFILLGFIVVPMILIS